MTLDKHSDLVVSKNAIKLSGCWHDRLGSFQSGQWQQPTPIKLVADRSDRSRQGPTHVRPLRQEYHVNEKKEEAQLMQVDPVKTTTSDVMEIGDVKVVVKDFGKGPMVFGK